jgi:transposase
MRLPPFLPHLKGLCLAEIAVTEEGITLRLFVARRTARRPSCQRRAHRIHGRYKRTIADFP